MDGGGAVTGQQTGKEHRRLPGDVDLDIRHRYAGRRRRGTGNCRRKAHDNLVAGDGTVIAISSGDNAWSSRGGRSTIDSRPDAWREIHFGSRLPFSVKQKIHSCGLAGGVGRALHGLPLIPALRVIGGKADKCDQKYAHCEDQEDHYLSSFHPAIVISRSAHSQYTSRPSE
jgi:hypothetical protein